MWEEIHDEFAGRGVFRGDDVGVAIGGVGGVVVDDDAELFFEVFGDVMAVGDKVIPVGGIEGEVEEFFLRGLVY